MQYTGDDMGKSIGQLKIIYEKNEWKKRNVDPEEIKTLTNYRQCLFLYIGPGLVIWLRYNHLKKMVKREEISWFVWQAKVDRYGQK